MSRLGWRRGVVVVIAVVAVSLAGGRTTTLGPAVKNCRVAGRFSEADSLLDHTGGRSPQRAGRRRRAPRSYGTATEDQAFAVTKGAIRGPL